MKMDVYSIIGRDNSLLLVDGLRVINGAYNLESRRNKEGLFVPHGDLKVKHECKIDVVYEPNSRLVDYTTTLDNAEKLIKERNGV